MVSSPPPSSPPPYFPALIDNSECIGREREVGAHTQALREQWAELLLRIDDKTQKLREANQQQQFNEAVKDMDFWLGEVCI